MTDVPFEVISRLESVHGAEFEMKWKLTATAKNIFCDIFFLSHHEKLELTEESQNVKLKVDFCNVAYFFVYEKWNC